MPRWLFYMQESQQRTWIINSCRQWHQQRWRGYLKLKSRKKIIIYILYTFHRLYTSIHPIYIRLFIYFFSLKFFFVLSFVLLIVASVIRIPSNRSIMVWCTCIIIRAMFETKMLFVRWQSLFDRMANFVVGLRRKRRATFHKKERKKNGSGSSK